MDKEKINQTLEYMLKEPRNRIIYDAGQLKGAAAERERIRKAVLSLGGLKMGESDYVLLKLILALLKDGEGA